MQPTNENEMDATMISSRLIVRFLVLYFCFEMACKQLCLRHGKDKKQIVAKYHFCKIFSPCF